MPAIISPADNVFFAIYKRSSSDAATGLPGAGTLEQENIPAQFVDFALSLDRLVADADNRSDTYRLHVSRQNLTVEESKLSGRKVIVTHEKGLSGLYSALSAGDRKRVTFEIKKATPATREKLVLTLVKGVGLT